MKYHIILLLIILSYRGVYSQEKEYLVTNDNDTIYGKIIRGTNYLNPSKTIFKIKDKEGKKHLINPAEVKVLRSLKGVDGDCIIRTVYGTFFIKKIIHGRINVFQMIDNVFYYTSKDNEKIKAADFGGFGSRKKAHAEIRTLIKDNPKILKEFDSLKGSAKNILYIIKKYNQFYY
ncbi:hypothetical protein [uncultured Dokdonia sp.]|uniref:hypothetical protein n=1 Tax=uncultured Dokdonia sp. TaxID=575653 RepID=UPI002631D630|nr:hypothetical protein [uncultured Dokdonia sp.]